MFPFQLHFNFFNSELILGPYALFFFLAILFTIVGCLIFAVKSGFSFRSVLFVLISMLFTAVIGARLLNIIVNNESYLADPAQMISFSTMGFSVYGGIISALLTGFITSRFLKLNSFQLGDTFIPFLGFGISIMRIGCFLQGCCFGKETDLFWGITFPLLSPAHLHQISTSGNFLTVDPVHPTQLFELVFAFSLGIVSLLMLKKKLNPGTTLVTFLTSYSAFRLINLFFRAQPESFSVSPYFYPLLYSVMISIGLWILTTSKRTAEIQK